MLEEVKKKYVAKPIQLALAKAVNAYNHAR